MKCYIDSNVNHIFINDVNNVIDLKNRNRNLFQRYQDVLLHDVNE